MAEKSPAALAMAGATATSPYLKLGLVHTAKSPTLQAHILESGPTAQPCARYDLALPESPLARLRFDKLSIFQQRFSASMVFSELSDLILSSLLPKDKDKLN